MTTEPKYAIAYTDHAIWGTVPMAGGWMSALEAQVKEYSDDENPLWESDQLRIATDVILTNDEDLGVGPNCVFASGNGACGWILDEAGNSYNYAVSI